MPTAGNAAENTAEPQPPKTRTNVPNNSATSFFTLASFPLSPVFPRRGRWPWLLPVTGSAMGHCPNLLVESCGLDASCCRHSRCPCHRKTRRCWTRLVRGRYASMIALAFEFVLLGMQGLLVVAGIVSALRARLWGALAPTLAIGALV